jgi:hypothetical protein
MKTTEEASQNRKAVLYSSVCVLIVLKKFVYSFLPCYVCKINVLTGCLENLLKILLVTEGAFWKSLQNNMRLSVTIFRVKIASVSLKRITEMFFRIKQFHRRKQNLCI